MPPAKGNQVTSKMIKQLSQVFPVVKLCKILEISRSAYYAWLKRPVKINTLELLNLYPKAKQLFNKSRNSLGCQELIKKLRREDFNVSDYDVQRLMATLGDCNGLMFSPHCLLAY